MPGDPTPLEAVLAEPLWLLVAYVALVATSGVPNRLLVRRLKPNDADWPTDVQATAGTVVGKCENVLVLTFVLADAYTALAVIFAAEGLVTRDLEEDYKAYVLAGTLLNITYSAAFAVGVRAWLG